MAGSVNKVILVGSLGRDPEIRSTQGGTRIANLSVATSESWRDRGSGERKEKTEWHRVSIFNDKLADVAEKYLRKGSKVYIEGQLQNRKWTDKDGQERYSTEVVLSGFGGQLVMLDGPRSQDAPDRQDWRDTGREKPVGRNADYDPARHRTGSVSRGRDDDLDSEIPF